MTEDAELLKAFAGGDPQGFTGLLMRHRAALYAAALRVLRNPHDAEDALSVALIKAMENASSYRGEAEVLTWLRRIVVNTSLSMATRRAVLDGRTRLVGDGADVAEEFDQEPLGRVDAGDVEMQMLLDDALRRLPDTFRRAIFLFGLRGFSITEVAEIEGVQPGTIKSRVWRARLLLREDVTSWRESGNL